MTDEDPVKPMDFVTLCVVVSGITIMSMAAVFLITARISQEFP